MADVPHFRVPLEFVNGSLAVVEQDTEQEVEQCIEAVLRYHPGDLLTRTKFGIPDLTFRTIRVDGVNIDDVIAAVAKWETRLGVTFDQASVSVADVIVGVALTITAQSTGATSG